MIEGLKEILEQVKMVCEVLDIDFFIVGAVAKNIWLTSNNEKAEGTKDIDCAVYIPTQKKYDALKDILVKKHFYTQSSENEFCLISPTKQEIDLLPFGEIENNNKARIEGEGMNVIKLEGFKESYEMSLLNVQIGNEVYKTCSIPAIMILKFIAFDDRPEMRFKDVKDINAICKHYPEIETEFIWDKYNELYDDTKEHNEVAMIVLGKEMKKIVFKNTSLQERLLNIIDKVLTQKSNFLSLMIEDLESETIEMKRAVLKYLKEGLQ